MIVALAISSLTIVALAIFADVIALFVITGKSAVPVKSPTNLIFPLTDVLASGVAAVI